MDVLELRRRVENALVDAGVKVGTYTLPGGLTTPALYVGDPPQGTTATGLEVMILPNPRPRIVSTFGGGINVKSWEIRVVEHTDDADLDGALDALAEAFGPIPTPQLIPEAGDIAEQAIVTIPDDPE